MVGAARPDRAAGVAGQDPVQGQYRYQGVALLGGLQGQLGSHPGSNGVDQRTRRVVQPVAVRLGISRRPGLATGDLLGEDQDADGEIINLKLATHRNGPTGEIKMWFKKSQTRFVNYAGERYAEAVH